VVNQVSLFKISEDKLTPVQNEIENIVVKITPISVSLANVNGIDPDLVEGCREYYEFVNELLEDLYLHTGEYELPDGNKLNILLDGTNLSDFRRKNPSQINKVNQLVSNSKGAFKFLQFIMGLGKLGNYCDHKLTLTLDQYNTIITKVNPKSSQSCVDAFRKNGLAITQNEKVVVESDRPNLLLAIKKLADSIDTVKTFGEQGFLYCEFRQIFRGHTPNYDDVTRPLTPEVKKTMDSLHKYMLEMKASPSCTTFWKVNYKYKGIQLAQISTEGRNGRIWVYGSDNSLLNKMLSEEDDDFKQFALDNLRACICCSTKHNGGFPVNVLGHEKYLCGSAISFSVLDPSAENFDFVRRLLDLRVKLIK
jgi:hypothetical protein